MAINPESEACDTSTRGHFRWVICALLLLAAVINYVDRQVIGICIRWGAAGRCWAPRSERCRGHHVSAPWRNYLMSVS
jgi:hypothetical protein